MYTICTEFALLRQAVVGSCSCEALTLRPFTLSPKTGDETGTFLCAISLDQPCVPEPGGRCTSDLCSHVAVCIICVYQLDTSLLEDAVSAQNRQLNADSTKRKAQEINQGNGGGKKNEPIAIGVAAVGIARLAAAGSARRRHFLLSCCDCALAFVYLSQGKWS